MKLFGVFEKIVQTIEPESPPRDWDGVKEIVQKLHDVDPILGIV